MAAIACNACQWSGEPISTMSRSFSFEHLAIVAVGSRRFVGLLPLAGDFHGLGQHPLVRIADGHDLDRRHLDQPPQVALAVPAGADQSDTLGLSGDDLKRFGAERPECERRGASLDETAAIDLKRRCRRSFPLGYSLFVVHAIPSFAILCQRACYLPHCKPDAALIL